MSPARGWSALRSRLALRPRSIRTQVVLWNVLTLAVLLVALEAVTYTLARRAMLSGVDQHLRLRTRGMVERMRHEDSEGMLGRPHDGPGRDFGGGPPGERGPEGGGGRQDNRPRVFDAQGKSMGPQAEAPWDAAAVHDTARGRERFTDVALDDVPMRVLTVPVVVRSQVRAVVQAAVPTDQVQSALVSLARTLLLLLPVALALAAVGGQFLAGRVLRPVGRLSKAAERIGAEAITQRLPSAGADEFASLAGTMNGMLARLETGFREQQRLVELQRQFVADASHELRTPLTLIKGSTSLCKSGDPTPDDYRQSIDEIDRAAASMSSLVQDLLLLARADGDQLGRNPIELPIGEALRMARSAVAHGSRNVAIRLDVDDEALCILGNEGEITRLFTNLFENAVRYSPDGATVTAKAWREDGDACVTVSDTGIGIAPEHLPHLGERFYRVDQSRTREGAGGAGLGLSICRSIVAAHRGSIAFESEPGMGTTVTVRLPAA